MKMPDKPNQCATPHMNPETFSHFPADAKVGDYFPSCVEDREGQFSVTYVRYEDRAKGFVWYDKRDDTGKRKYLFKTR